MGILSRAVCLLMLLTLASSLSLRQEPEPASVRSVSGFKKSFVRSSVESPPKYEEEDRFGQPKASRLSENDPCEGKQYAPYPGDCTRYLQCHWDRLEAAQCGSGLHWNSNAGICDWPENAHCEDGGGPDEGGNVTVEPTTTPPPNPTDRPDLEPLDGYYKVVCYFTNWAWYRNGLGRFTPDNINTDLCTHVVYAFAILDYSELTLRTHDSWADLDNKFYTRVTDLKAKGVKVSLALGGWNDSQGDKYSRLVRNPAARAKFIQHAIGFLDQYGFEGLDLDWEYPVCWQTECDKGFPDEKEGFAAWVRELSEAFKPRGLLLSTAASPSKVIIDAAYDVPALAPYFDWIAVMTYDYHGQWDKKTGHVAPLYNHPDDDFDYFNTHYSINYWIEKGAPSRKIVMGMPLYGQSFTLANVEENGLNAKASGPGQAGEFTGAAGFLAYYEICDRINNQGWEVVQDEEGRMGPFARKGNQWVSFDDTAMIRKKSQLVRDMNLGGGMVWALDLDDFNNRCGSGVHPLLTQIHEVLKSPPTDVEPTSGLAKSFVRSSVESPPKYEEENRFAQPKASRLSENDPCEGKQYAPYPGDCTRYLQCHWDRLEAAQCGSGLHWNSNAGLCDWPENAHCEDGGEPDEGGNVTVEPTTTPPPNPTDRPDLEPLDGYYKVVCYFTNWAWYRNGLGRFTPDNINTDLCTHVVYAFAILDYSELTLRTHDSWADLDNKFYTRVTDLKAKGVKVSLALGGWNDSQGDKYSRLVRNPAARAKFIQHAIGFLDQYGFEGLDLDWEYPVCWQTECDKGFPDEKEGFAAWVRELSEAFKPRGLLLSTAASPSKVIIDAAYDVPALAPYFDWIAVMTYDYHGQWDKKTGHVAPLYNHPDDDFDYFNTHYSINYWIEKGAPSRKIVMGMPLYGQSFTLANVEENGLNAKASGPGQAGEFTGAAGFLAYYEICDRINNQGWEVVQDEEGRMGPFARKGNQWVSFDDTAMIRKKSQLVRDMNLGGGMVWALDLDDFNNRCGSGVHPLLTQIHEVLKSPPTDVEPTSGLAKSFVRSSVESPPKYEEENRFAQPKASRLSENDPCEGKQYAPYPGDCTRYLQCHWDRLEAAQCGSGLHWNSNAGLCDWPENAHCEDGGEPDEGGNVTVEPTTTPPPNPTDRPDLEPLDGYYKVVCYFTNWAWYRNGLGRFTPDNINTDLCTHVVYAFAILDYSELTLRTHDSWADLDNKFYTRVTDLKAKGVKVSLALGGWNDSQGDKYSRLVRNPAARAKFIQHAIGFLDQYGFEGLDLDWEYPVCWQTECDKGFPDEKEGFAAWVRELSEAFKPRGLLLSTAASPSKVIIDAAYDVPALAPYFDWIAVMTYDYHGQWDKKTGHVAPLYNHPDDDFDYFNTHYSINYWIEKGAPSRKIVMGMPLYGQSFTLANVEENGLNAKASGPGQAGEFTGAAGFLAYYEICDRIKTQGWEVIQDEEGRMGPFARKGNQWVSFDDTAMIRKKSQLVRDMNLGGGMVWALDLDDFNNRCGSGVHPLLTQIHEVLKSPPTDVEPTSGLAKSFVRSSVESPPKYEEEDRFGQPKASRLSENDPCEGKQYAPYPGDCTRYLQCHWDRLEAAQCGSGLHWNSNAGLCDWPENAHCEDGGGPDEGGNVTVEPTTTPPPNPTDRPDLEPLDGYYKVVCYFTNWAWYRNGLGRFTPDNINTDLCTHVVYAFAILDYSELTLRTHDSWADLDNKFYTRVTDLKAKGVKVSLALGGWNDSQGDKYSRLVRNPAARAKFIQHAIGFLDQYGFEGLDLDWEYPVCWQTECDKGFPDEKEGFAAWVRELSEAFKPRGLLLSTAASPSKVIIDAAYDVPALAPYFDWIAVMTYDYHGQWDKKTGHVAPLYNHPDDDFDYFNTHYSINYWIEKGAPSRKIVMGMPLYGQSFTLANVEENGLNAKASGPGQAGEFTGAAGFLAYYEICDRINNQGWEVVQDEEGRMGPFARKGNQWVSFDDTAMIRKKSQLVRDMNLGGGMVWALDLDDFNNRCGSGVHPLLTQIHEVLKSPPTDVEPTSGLAKSFVRSSVESPPKYEEEDRFGQPKASRLSENDPCEGKQYAPYPGDCTRYLQCHWDRLEAAQCGSGLHWNSNAGLCDWPENAHCEDGGGPDEGGNVTVEPTTTPPPNPTDRPDLEPLDGYYKVVCYFTNWAWYRNGLGRFTPDNINTDLCTHVVYAFAILDYSELTLRTHDSWADLDNKFYTRVTDLKAKGVKVSLALGGWNDSQGDKYSRLVRNPAARAKFIQHAIGFLDQYGFEGLDLDWEYPVCWQTECDKGFPDEKEGFAAWVRELSEAFKPRGLLLSTAASPSKVIIDAAYDVPALAPYFDWIAVMTYDYHGQWDKKTGHVAPLYNHPDDDFDYFNTHYSINYWIEKGAPSRKIVMGMPLYGQSFTLANVEENGLNAKASGPGQAGEFTGAAGFLAYYEICDRINNQGWEVVQDEEGRMGPFARKGNQWVSFDDTAMIRKKSQLVRDMNLGGGMVWALDLDDFNNRCGSGVHPLLTQIHEVLKSPPTDVEPTSGLAKSFVRSSVESPPKYEEENRFAQPKASRLSENDPCEGKQYAPYPGDCTRYLQCHWDRLEAAQCGSGLHWNSNAGLCDWPENAHCEDGGEPDEGGNVTVEPTTTPPPNPTDRPDLEPLDGYYKVVCYFTNWAWYRNGLGRFTPDNINTDLCTHVVYAFAILDYSELTLRTHDSWADLDNKFYTRVTDLKAKGVKVSLALGGWNDSQGDKYSRLVRNPAARAKFIQHAIGFLDQYGFEGLDLDWEYPVCWQTECDKGFPDEKEGFAAWVRELSEAFKPRGLLLSTAASPSKVIIDAAYDVPALAPYFDWIAVMTYDYHGQWDKKTGHVAPLYNHPDDDFDYFNTHYSINYWIEKGAPSRKIVMGMPLYGQSFTLANVEENGLNAKASGPGQAGEFTGAAGFLAYYEICDRIKTQGWEVIQDEEGRMGPFARKGNQWVSFDDTAMIRKKSQLVRDMNLGGGMVWALDLDDFNNRCGSGVHPLLTQIHEVLKSPPTDVELTLGLTPSDEPQVLVESAPVETVGENLYDSNTEVEEEYKVVCYFTNWAWYRQDGGKFLPEHIDADLCTHIVYGFAVLNQDTLTIQPHDSWADVDNKFYERVTSYRAKGIKVTVALGGWNDSAGDKYARLVRSAEARARFIQHAMEFIETHNFDGLDLDWEYPVCWQVDCNRGDPEEKEGFAALARELSEKFKPRGLLLSAAVSPNKKVIDTAYDVPELSQHFDWLAVMTYDYHGQWDKKTGHVAPMYDHPDDDDLTFNSNFSINYWISQGADRRKLVMGMPMYGQSFSLAQANDHDLNALTYGGGEAGESTRARGFLAYYEICEYIRDKQWNVVRDPSGRMGPYAYLRDQWVSFDDAPMIRDKSEYVKAMGLGGAMIWALDLDDFNNVCDCESYPLLKTINRVLRKYPGPHPYCKLEEI